MTKLPTEGYLKLTIAMMTPYAKLARLDHPIGTWLLLIPCWWGLALALQQQHRLDNVFLLTLWQHPDLTLHFIHYAILMAIGAILMRGAGCTLNDMVDYQFDTKVERTKDRPIANGKISHKQAAIFFIIQVLCASTILLYFPWQSWICALLSLPLITIYPFMKRITWYPQLFLGLTFNWGIWLGWVSLSNPSDMQDKWIAPAILYIAGIFWTLGYDTIYAHQDKKDDRIIGIKSTALRFNQRSRLWIFLFYSIMITFLILFGYIMSLNAWVWACGIVIMLACCFYYVLYLDTENNSSCLEIFKANRYLGIIIALFILLS